MNMTITSSSEAVAVCSTEDLIPNSGVAVKVGESQVAVFYLPNEPEMIFALDNYDPIGQANVMSRGIVGDRGGQLVVASPLYKQHFDLRSGKCQEEPDVCLQAYKAKIDDGKVWIWL